MCLKYHGLRYSLASSMTNKNIYNFLVQVCPILTYHYQLLPSAWPWWRLVFFSQPMEPDPLLRRCHWLVRNRHVDWSDWTRETRLGIHSGSQPSSCSCQGDEKEHMNMLFKGDDKDNMQITPMNYNTVPQQKMVERLLPFWNGPFSGTS